MSVIHGKSIFGYEGSLVMNCEFCNAIFTNKSVLAVHVKKDHGKKGKAKVIYEHKSPKVKQEPKSPKDHDKEKDPLNVKEEPKELGIWYPNPKKDALKVEPKNCCCFGIDRYVFSVY